MSGLNGGEMERNHNDIKSYYGFVFWNIPDGLSRIQIKPTECGGAGPGGGSRQEMLKLKVERRVGHE